MSEKDQPMKRVKVRGGPRALPNLSVEATPGTRSQVLGEVVSLVREKLAEFAGLYEQELKAAGVRLVALDHLFECLTDPVANEETVRRCLAAAVLEPLEALYEHVVSLQGAKAAQAEAVAAVAAQEAYLYDLLSVQETKFAKMCENFCKEEVKNLQGIVVEDAGMRATARRAMVTLMECRASALATVEKIGATSRTLNDLLRQTSAEVRAGELRGASVFKRSDELEVLQKNARNLATMYSELRLRYERALQEFVAAEEKITEWETTWTERTHEVGIRGRQFEAVGVDPYKLARVDREKLFTLPEAADRGELHGFLAPVLPVPKETVSSTQLAAVDDLLLELSELPSKLEEPVASAKDGPSTPPPQRSVSPLRLVVCAYAVLNRACSPDTLHAFLESVGLTYGVERSKFREAFREAVGHGHLTGGLGASRDRQGLPKVARISDRGKSTVTGLRWLYDQMPEGFADHLQRAVEDFGK